MSDDSRLEALEVKVAFLEDALQQLSDEVLLIQREQQALKLLNQQLKSKVNTLESSQEGDGLAQSERPPHY